MSRPGNAAYGTVAHGHSVPQKLLKLAYELIGPLAGASNRRAVGPLLVMPSGEPVRGSRIDAESLRNGCGQ